MPPAGLGLVHHAARTPDHCRDHGRVEGFKQGATEHGRGHPQPPGNSQLLAAELAAGPLQAIRHCHRPCTHQFSSVERPQAARGAGEGWLLLAEGGAMLSEHAGLLRSKGWACRSGWRPIRDARRAARVTRPTAKIQCPKSESLGVCWAAGERAGGGDGEQSGRPVRNIRSVTRPDPPAWPVPDHAQNTQLTPRSTSRRLGRQSRSADRSYRGAGCAVPPLSMQCRPAPGSWRPLLSRRRLGPRRPTPVALWPYCTRCRSASEP